MTTQTETVDVDSLPPTQYLVLEVLAARHRLGEEFWTFPSRLGATINALVQAGLVWSRSAPTPHAVQVGLTDTGRAEVLDAGYQPPAVRESVEYADVERLRAELAGYKDAHSVFASSRALVAQRRDAALSLLERHGVCAYPWRAGGVCGRPSGHLGFHGDEPAEFDQFKAGSRQVPASGEGE